MMIMIKNNKNDCERDGNEDGDDDDNNDNDDNDNNDHMCFWHQQIHYLYFAKAHLADHHTIGASN